MIIQLNGNVKHPITLDAGVWIFDDRKIEFDHLFEQPQNEVNTEDEENKKASKRWEKELSQEPEIKKPINKGLSRSERNKILESTYVMSIEPFIKNASPNETAKFAHLISNDGHTEVTLEDLKQGFFLFAVNGKPIKEDGPLHFYFGDESKKDTPIKGIKEIKIV